MRRFWPGRLSGQDDPGAKDFIDKLLEEDWNRGWVLYKNCLLLHREYNYYKLAVSCTAVGVGFYSVILAWVMDTWLVLHKWFVWHSLPTNEDNYFLLISNIKIPLVWCMHKLWIDELIYYYGDIAIPGEAK